MNDASFVINEYDDEKFHKIDPSEARIFMNMLARKIKNNTSIEYRDLSEYIISDHLDDILSHFKESIDVKENYDVNVVEQRAYHEDDTRELSLKILPKKYINDMSKIHYRVCFIQF
jgi:hypothetical protein